MVKIASRRELLDRWKSIEDEEQQQNQQNDDDDPSKQRKEKWFADTFNFLISLPKETHIWCGFWDLMGPLLETFYNYFKDERSDSPLRLLWKRVSEEMRHCVQCISQHHQAQEMYGVEYEFSSIGPLLNVLRCLDEERVTLHLKEVNGRLKKHEYDPLRDNADVVSLMYEVLMFPILLDDQSLSTEFELFIEAVDSVHELALAGHQQFPGVYALLFFSRRVRTVGRRLARSMDKLRRAAEMEPLQPLLNKFVGFLEADALPSASNTSRPRVQLERTSIWLGITSLLEFLEPPVFEEAMLERYPIFLDIVLNHISGDSAEFSHAVSCLKELFKMLGCKLWLRSTLSPSVMRNTLLGQCFHTRNEKIHKDIFDLFPPFLQSLEALQDGEHEKQRRHFLYFLLHQVSVSSNFNVLTKKLACKIALLIVNRGYTMNPPCPPVECAHMWGPSFVSSLKDSSLHSSLRQPAFDLIQAIIVSDATALANMMLNYHTPLDDRSTEFNDGEDDDDELPFFSNVEEKDNSCWRDFSAQSKITSQEYKGWMCVPMIWIDVLVDTDPSILPVSFSKAVFWARSFLTMTEPETAAEMALGVKSWLLSSAAEISNSFGWKVPTGSNDGGGGNESKNSVRVSMMHLPLLRTFNRLTAHFIVQMGQSELQKQWTWEPRMAESLVLSLVDPNDGVRQVGKCLLEQVSESRGLACGLKFLCSSCSSMSATFLGLRHALKVVQLDSVISKFQSLQHFYFILQKLIKEGDSPNPILSENSNIKQYSSQGGFLMQPAFDSLHINVDEYTSNVDLKSQEKFRCLLSEAAWPSILKCLVEGKEFIDYSLCQMTCVRVLEILPVVFKRLYPSFNEYSRDSGKIMEKVFDFLWLHDLIDWGKSPLKVVIVYWKRTITSLLSLLRGSCSNTLVFTVIENLILSESVDVDQLMEQVSLLRVSLSKEVAWSSGKTLLGPKTSFSEDLHFSRKYSAPDLQPAPSEETSMEFKDSVLDSTDKSAVIVLSDDEAEQISPAKVTLPDDGDPGHSRLDNNTVSCTPADDGSGLLIGTVKEVRSLEIPRDLRHEQQDALDKSSLTSQKQASAKLRGKPPTSITPIKSIGKDKKKEVKSSVNDSVAFLSQPKKNLKNLSDESVSAESVEKVSLGMICGNRDSTLKQIVCDAKDVPHESELKSVKKQPLFLPKLSVSAPKRQVIQLKTHTENRFGNLHRREAGVKRFKPPRLDDWYRPILEINYFEIVGLSSASEKTSVSRLKEVPVCFQSPEQYVEIFRPLVLEEFKAQLHSSFLEMSSWEDMYYGKISVMSVERVDDFHLVRFVHDDNDSTSPKGFSENDLVLLTKEVPQNKCPDIHMVGKVENRERDNKRKASLLLIRFYFLNGSSRLNQARKLVIDRSKWHASRIMSITPQFREIQVLSALKNIPILPVILNPVADSPGDKSREVSLVKLSQPLQEVLKSSFNDSQLQAITTAVGSPNLKKELELSLIQGPPGTGKTRTIVAIVSALLASLCGPSGVKNFQNRGSKHFNSSSGTGPKLSQSVAVARAWQDAALARQLNEEVRRTERSVESSVRGRILICAQSNAAVDELVSRIYSGGLYGSDGTMYKPYLVRVGNPNTIHPDSLPFFIDTLVDCRIQEEKMHSGDANNESSTGSSTALRAKLEKLVDGIRYYEAKRANLQDTNSDLKKFLDDETFKGDDLKEMSDPQLAVKLRKLYEQKKQIFKELSGAQARERKSGQEIKAVKHKIRKSILKEAELVVTTLSGCGGDLYDVCSESISSCKFGNPSEHTLFDAVVIDEAAQALEPATLIPLQLLKSYGTKCIMVGDPKQLPATVLSNVASKLLYECSMFERIQKAGYPVTMLTKQYRMHSEICRFPSSHFYDGKLLNGENMSNKTAPFHETEGLGPYVFYDVVDGQELRGKSSGSFSLHNDREAAAAAEVIRFFKKRHPSEFEAKRIGIITPYKSQLSVLRSRFSSVFGPSVIANMEFNTIDGFQGREVDILILSTVRATESNSHANGFNSSSIGFVADIRRMNVALTRAKVSLWIFGNARTLLGNHNWAALVNDAKDRKLVIPVRRPYRNFKTALTDNVNPEKSDDHSTKTNHVENVIHSVRHSKQVKQKFKKACYGHEEGKTVAGDENNCSPKRKDVHGSRDGARDSSDLLSVDASGARRKLKNVEAPVSEESVRDDKRMSSERSEKKLKQPAKKEKDMEKLEKPAKKDKYMDSKSKENSVRETSESHKRLKENVLKGQDKLLKHDKDLKINTSIAEGSVEGTKSKDMRGPDKKGTYEDLITKRKKQREAVDAILDSSLISSKKKESSKKSVPSKRSISPSSIASSGIRPPKTRKGKE
ncbi:P-loop containing nucleoside triphosphate hydrolases superfamily protein [Euphorbia peplus]|nr:P-loop containing nucleoside triphosphate hydrolases superfamily protein [Euphorbia peplus]